MSALLMPTSDPGYYSQTKLYSLKPEARANVIFNSRIGRRTSEVAERIENLIWLKY
jgi:hypothetical protein